MMDPATRFHHVDALFRELTRAGPVLELGCGDGRVLAMMRAAGWDVMGIDIDPAALRAARKRGLGALAVADGERLPFPDETFGTVLAGYFAANLMDRDRMVAEAARVLRPGGVLAYTLLNPVTRFVDHVQYALRHGRLRRIVPRLRAVRRLGDPLAEADRLRRHGLIPLPVRGPLYLLGLRRFPDLYRRAPVLSGLWTRAAWEVVVAAVRPPR